MPTVLITGATRGLGLAAAQSLAGRAHVVVGGRDPERTAAVADEIGGTPLVLDLSSLASVAASEIPDVDVLICNAGLQFPGEALRVTTDGFEETFQVNFLAHLALIDRLRPARIVLVGSGTHDPTRHTGMPDPREDDIPAIARGEMDGGRRRYSTSKLLCTAATGALARERPDIHVSCLDPGLMTATGLARDYPAPLARVYNALGGVIGRLIPLASTPQRSGAWLAALAVDDPPPTPSGTVIDHRGRPARISPRAGDPAFQDEVLRETRALL